MNSGKSFLAKPLKEAITSVLSWFVFSLDVLSVCCHLKLQELRF